MMAPVAFASVKSAFLQHGKQVCVERSLDDALQVGLP